MRGSAALGLTTLCAIIALAVLPARAEGCAKADFETAVEDAAMALRELNAKHKPTFQDKLRALKRKQGWSNDQFMKEAAVYVQDSAINALDSRSGDLLARINSLGATGAAGSSPDCELLKDLRRAMQELVETQVTKWNYMFAKLDKALTPRP